MRGRTDRGSVSETGAKRSAIVTGEEPAGGAADVAAPHVAGGPVMMTVPVWDARSFGREDDALILAKARYTALRNQMLHFTQDWV